VPPQSAAAPLVCGHRWLAEEKNDTDNYEQKDNAATNQKEFTDRFHGGVSSGLTKKAEPRANCGIRIYEIQSE
jgi:hypothetical protein